MKIWVLGSGSRGNAVLLDCGRSRVLIDAGFPVRTLAERLGHVGVSCESIEALVLTHEHADHVKGATAAAQRWGWPLYATVGTAEAYPGLREADVRTFDSGGSISLSELQLQSVRVPHDAADPVALVATASGTGVRAGIVYDLGSVTPVLRAALTRLDMLVLEANHDEGMLRAGPYPPSVRARIAGTRGHLSNGVAADLVRGVAHANLAHVVLAHLSDRCNDPALARSAVEGELRRTRRRVAVHVASQDAVLGPFQPRRGRSVAGIQLALAL
jgi:phosphoribosyl 1,2-cyclic phosphodiesterase